MLTDESANQREIPVEPLDLFGAGFSCQPWAPGGLGLGKDDPRSAVLLDVLHFIRTNRPKMILLDKLEQAFNM